MKRAIISLSAELLKEFFITGSVMNGGVCKKGLTKSAKFVRGGFKNSINHETIELLFESEEFEDIKDGNVYPYFVPYYEKIKPTVISGLSFTKEEADSLIEMIKTQTR